MVTLSVTLPATYPKTLPQCRVTYTIEVRQTTRAEVDEVIKKKPKELLGTEMVFELATSIQDILEEATSQRAKDGPTLNEERVLQEAATQEVAKAQQEEQLKLLEVAEEEEDRMLSLMVEREHARIAKLHARPVQDKQSQVRMRENGDLTFDHHIKTKDADGAVVAFRTVRKLSAYVTTNRLADPSHNRESGEHHSNHD